MSSTAYDSSEDSIRAYAPADREEAIKAATHMGHEENLLSPPCRASATGWQA
jgi:hypothetical protein